MGALTNRLNQFTFRSWEYNSFVESNDTDIVTNLIRIDKLKIKRHRILPIHSWCKNSIRFPLKSMVSINRLKAKNTNDYNATLLYAIIDYFTIGIGSSCDYLSHVVKSLIANVNVFLTQKILQGEYLQILRFVKKINVYNRYLIHSYTKQTFVDQNHLNELIESKGKEINVILLSNTSLNSQYLNSFFHENFDEIDIVSTSTFPLEVTKYDICFDIYLLMYLLLNILVTIPIYISYTMSLNISDFPNISILFIVPRNKQTTIPFKSFSNQIDKYSRHITVHLSYLGFHDILNNYFSMETYQHYRSFIKTQITNSWLTVLYLFIYSVKKRIAHSRYYTNNIQLNSYHTLFVQQSLYRKTTIISQNRYSLVQKRVFCTEHNNTEDLTREERELLCKVYDTIKNHKLQEYQDLLVKHHTYNHETFEDFMSELQTFIETVLDPISGITILDVIKNKDVREYRRILNRPSNPLIEQLRKNHPFYGPLNETYRTRLGIFDNVVLVNLITNIISDIMKIGTPLVDRIIDKIIDKILKLMPKITSTTLIISEYLEIKPIIHELNDLITSLDLHLHSFENKFNPYEDTNILFKPIILKNPLNYGKTNKNVVEQQQEVTTIIVAKKLYEAINKLNSAIANYNYYVVFDNEPLQHVFALTSAIAMFID